MWEQEADELNKTEVWLWFFLKYVMYDFITACSFKVLAIVLPTILEIYNLSHFFSWLCFTQVFTLNVPDAFYRCYSPTLEKTKDRDAVMQVMAEQIVTLCATLDENPGVRYKRWGKNTAL